MPHLVHPQCYNYCTTWAQSLNALNSLANSYGKVWYVPASVQLSRDPWELKFLLEQMATPLCSIAPLMLFQGGMEFSSVIMHGQLPARLSALTCNRHVFIYFFVRRLWKVFIYLSIFMEREGHGSLRNWHVRKNGFNLFWFVPHGASGSLQEQTSAPNLLGQHRACQGLHIYPPEQRSVGLVPDMTSSFSIVSHLATLRLTEVWHLKKYLPNQPSPQRLRIMVRVVVNVKSVVFQTIQNMLYT